MDTKYEETSYVGLGKIIKVLCPQDVDEYMRRFAAIAAMGNLDAHLKNWTLRYPDGRTPRLSPAYDLVSVAAYPEFRGDQLAFSLGGGRSARLITSEHFRRLARTVGVDVDKAMHHVDSTVRQLGDSWSQVKRDCEIPSFLVEHIEDRLRSLPLFQGR